MSARPVILITAADLAPQALALLTDYEIVYAGKTPSEDDIIALCKQHDPVAIIVRYSKVGAAAMDSAPSLKVISKHGSGTDTIDKEAAKQRGIQVVAAVGANAAAVAEQALALLLACAKSVVTLNERMHAGFWDKATHKSIELEGRTIGVIDRHAQQSARQVFHLHEFQSKTGDCRLNSLCCTHALACLPMKNPFKNTSKIRRNFAPCDTLPTPSNCASKKKGR